MMDTEKLYYKDPYLADFTATVLTCEEGKSGYSVVLDRTAFYPEGGGQPTDKGTLGGVQVLEVHEKDGVITHLCDAPLAAGTQVIGRIDWARRFDHMQQHSGEHICSGLICARFHCDNVGFHMGTESVIIDYNAEIPWDGVVEIEQRANRYIWENHPFVAVYPSAEELKAMDYRSKKELSGQVRITSFPGADCCACCGTHVSLSGQVGLVKFISWQKFKDGVRLELLCGERALRYLATSWEQNRAVGQFLSAKPDKTFAAVERLQKELLETKERADALETASFAAIASEYAGKGDVVLVRGALQGDGARRLCDMVAAKCGGRCAVFAGEDGAYKYAVIHAGQDISGLIKTMNGALNGRGGGRDGFAQGSVSAAEAEIRAFFEQVK